MLKAPRVHTKVEFSGVPAGTPATVVRVDQCHGGHVVALEWDLSARAAPLVDWFRRSEWERFIEAARLKAGHKPSRRPTTSPASSDARRPLLPGCPAPGLFLILTFR
jgi:hypothetical protein